MVAAEYLDVWDSRTERSYQIPITNSVIKGQDLANIQSDASEKLKVLDPGFANTAIMYSNVAQGNSKASRLEFRGHDVYDLVERHDFEEVAYLLIWNRVPSPEEKKVFKTELAQKCLDMPESVEKVVRAFPKSAPYMTITIGALSAALAERPSLIPAVHGSHVYSDDMDHTDEVIIEVIATYAVCFCLAYCHKTSKAFRKAELGQSHIWNVFNMMGLVDPQTDKPDSAILDIMEQWWIVSADHELAHSTCATLLAGSALADPISCVISGISSGYGVSHLGATENSYRQQSHIAKVENVAPVVAECKAGARKIMGVGHRIYKAANDPRLVVVKQLLDEMKQLGYADPLIETSFELERQVNEDPFFRRKSLFVNFDLYWWGLYTALEVDINAVVPFFFVQRVCGLMAHWRELMTQKTTKLWRPNMIYTGPACGEKPAAAETERHPEDIKKQVEVTIQRVDSVILDSTLMESQPLVGGVR